MYLYVTLMSTRDAMLVVMAKNSTRHAVVKLIRTRNISVTVTRRSIFLKILSSGTANFERNLKYLFLKMRFQIIR